MEKRKETDLYPPVKAFFAAQGYEVKGEVNGCDLVATRGDSVIVVELKLAFTLALVFQAIERQRLTDEVFVAVPAPKRSYHEPRWREVEHLCRRLQLGLIAVRLNARGGPAVEVRLEPGAEPARKVPKRRAALLKEFRLRSGDYNLGGTTRQQLVTAYREESLRVAQYLAEHGPSKGAEIKKAAGVALATSICSKNYYGWFERVSTGVYSLTEVGRQALDRYAGVVGEITGQR